MLRTGSGVATRETPQIRVEETLFGKPVPTVWLQEHFWHGGNHLHWWDYATWFLHLTHFFATFIALAVIWVFAHDRFSRYATMVCVLALTGFATYVAYPAAPPWMAAQHGNLGESNRMIALVWQHLPFANGGAVFEHGKSYANDVAAMPSLHAAFALLFTLYLWRLVPRYVRPLLALYPLAMALALVYSGEHYVVDCIAGWVYAVAAFALGQLGVRAPCAACAAVRAGSRRLMDAPDRRCRPLADRAEERRAVRRFAATTSPRRC